MSDAAMLRDARGLIVSGASRAALEHFERALWRMLSYYGDAFADLDAALDEAPAFVMAHVARANLCLTLTERRFAAEAIGSLRRAGEIGGATARERAHLAASGLAAQGRWDEAGEAWDASLREHPLDILALQAGHLFDFYRGDAAQLRARVARLLPEWTPGVPLRSYVLGMQAFGFEECNLYPQAEALGRAALAEEPRDPWAVHAVTHVMEMTGRSDEGVDWLRSQAGVWSPENGLAFHNWWHLALFHIERGELDAALALYDERIAGGEFALQWLDGSALLWRLRLLGHDVGRRWQALADLWRAALEREGGFYAFNDWHAALALHAGGERADLEALRSALRRTAESAAPLQQMMASRIGLPLLDALEDFEAGRYRAAALEFAGLRRVAMGFGGSHAQRDLIDQTALVAAQRGGDAALARALLNERQAAKPHSALVRRYTERMPVAAAA